MLPSGQIQAKWWYSQGIYIGFENSRDLIEYIFCLVNKAPGSVCNIDIRHEQFAQLKYFHNDVENEDIELVLYKGAQNLRHNIFNSTLDIYKPWYDNVFIINNSNQSLIKHRLLWLTSHKYALLSGIPCKMPMYLWEINLIWFDFEPFVRENRSRMDSLTKCQWYRALMFSLL